MKKLFFLTGFSVAMAFLEAAVVVYLRHLYYPQGFSFPLNPLLATQILSVEWSREIATLIMLLCAGYLAGSTRMERFFYFLFSFGVWDIFYYVWLKVILNWPESLFTWDLLFLIPFAWTGPVLAPVVCSVTMIVFAIVFLSVKAKCETEPEVKPFMTILFLTGAILILTTFLKDFFLLLYRGGFFKQLSSVLSSPAFTDAVQHYIPKNYLWEVFIAGELFLCVSFFLFVFPCLKQRKIKK